MQMNGTIVFSGSGGKPASMNRVLNTTADFQESARSMVSILLMQIIIVLVQFMMKLIHKIARHERWANATYKNQNTGSNYVNLGTFAGPPYFEDTETVIYAKRMLRLPTLSNCLWEGNSCIFRCRFASRNFNKFIHRDHIGYYR